MKKIISKTTSLLFLVLILSSEGFAVPNSAVPLNRLSKYIIGDVNSDGIQDYIESRYSQTANVYVNTSGKKGSKKLYKIQHVRDFFREDPKACCVPSVYDDTKVNHIYNLSDLDGDGVDDFLINYINQEVEVTTFARNVEVTERPVSSYSVAYSGVNGSVIQRHPTYDLRGNRYKTFRSIPDVNADGINDYIFTTTSQNDQGVLLGFNVISGANGNLINSAPKSFTDVFDNIAIPINYQPQDVNVDGVKDYLVARQLRQSSLLFNNFPSIRYGLEIYSGTDLTTVQQLDSLAPGYCLYLKAGFVWGNANNGISPSIIKAIGFKDDPTTNKCSSKPELLDVNITTGLVEKAQELALSFGDSLESVSLLETADIDQDGARDFIVNWTEELSSEKNISLKFGKRTNFISSATGMTIISRSDSDDFSSLVNKISYKTPFINSPQSQPLINRLVEDILKFPVEFQVKGSMPDVRAQQQAVYSFSFAIPQNIPENSCTVSVEFSSSKKSFSKRIFSKVNSELLNGKRLGLFVMSMDRTIFTSRRKSIYLRLVAKSCNTQNNNLKSKVIKFKVPRKLRGKRSKLSRKKYINKLLKDSSFELL